MRDTDAIFEMWARWCYAGGFAAAGSQWEFAPSTGSGGGTAPVVDCIEFEIEMALSRLNVKKPGTMRVVQVEYGVDTPRGLSVFAKHLDKSLAINISLRTYERRLSAAKKHVLSCPDVLRFIHG